MLDCLSIQFTIDICKFFNHLGLILVSTLLLKHSGLLRKLNKMDGKAIPRKETCRNFSKEENREGWIL